MNGPVYSLAEGLADFICNRAPAKLSDDLLHQAKRLLLNQFKASAEATLQPAAQALLRQAKSAPQAHKQDGAAHVWWSDLVTSPEQAADLNAQSLRRLDFGDTHLPSLGQYTAGLVPELLARADAGGHTGRRLLEALVVGLEVDIACAKLIAAQTTRQPGARPVSIGAIAANCTLLGRDRKATTMVLAGLDAGFDMTPAALEQLFAGLGQRWHLHDIALHCRPVPAIALAPVDAALALRPQAGKRSVLGMQLGLAPQAWREVQACNDAPSQAAAELLHGVAASWQLGQFTADELLPACVSDKGVQALCSRIELRPDPSCIGLEACSLIVQFDDGSSKQCRIDAFLGAPGQALSDSQLSELFRSAANDLVLPRRSGEILQSFWGLDQAPDVRRLVSLLRPA